MSSSKDRCIWHLLVSRMCAVSADAKNLAKLVQNRFGIGVPKLKNDKQEPFLTKSSTVLVQLVLRRIHRVTGEQGVKGTRKLYPESIGSK